MGEAKRKREAVLNGPCPCGSQKTARLCCFNGQSWHKPPAVLGLKALPATGRVEKCYMKELGSCVAPISAEHIISDSVCRILMFDDNEQAQRKSQREQNGSEVRSVEPAAEVASKGVYVQAVLPAATRTEIYERAGGDVSKVPNVMEVEDLVDAALVGFDRQELVTIPPVPDVAAWEAFEKARGVLAAGFSNSKPAARYRA